MKIHAFQLNVVLAAELGAQTAIINPSLELPGIDVLSLNRSDGVSQSSKINDQKSFGPDILHFNPLNELAQVTAGSFSEIFNKWFEIEETSECGKHTNINLIFRGNASHLQVNFCAFGIMFVLDMWFDKAKKTIK